MSSSIITKHKDISWKITNEPVPYIEALHIIDKTVNDIINYKIPETIWLLSHLHVYTRGLSANNNELLNVISNIPIVNVVRGGKFTYHGPGQKIIYPMMDLRKRGKDIKKYIKQLEKWIIITLNNLGLDAFQKPDFVGVWVKYKGKDAKIAAIGVRISKWVSSHGIALNVNPNLEYFKAIIPCGIKNFGVTSLEQLGIVVSEHYLNQLLQKTFSNVFNIV